jgi:signal transduction histidine kinase
VSARREADALVLRVRDTGVGLAGAPPSNGTRFGVKQVRERLHTLYGDAASLALDAADDASGGGTVACIRLPFAALSADASPPSPLTTA